MDCVNGKAAVVSEDRFSASSTSDPMTSLGLIMSQSSSNGPEQRGKHYKNRDVNPDPRPGSFLKLSYLQGTRQHSFPHPCFIQTIIITKKSATIGLTWELFHKIAGKSLIF